MDIKEIKAKLSITAVLEYYGIKVNRNKQIHCLFHEDKNPSMQVYEDKGLVYCHSSNCPQGGKHMDGIEIFALMDRIDKHKAILKAQEFIGANPLAKPTLPTMTEEIPALSVVEVNYQELFTKLQQSFVKSDKAQAYAKERNINHAKLEIGYNASQSTIFKSLKNCIIFPLKNNQNEIVSLYGRSVTADDKNKHYYTANRKGLYHNANQETQIVILTESIIDSATLMVNCDLLMANENVATLALFGTNGFNQEHETLLKSLPNLQEIIFFLDGDEAGKQAVIKHSKTIHQLLPHIKISKVQTPADEDINSLTISHEAEILNHLIENRTLLFSPEVERLDTQLNQAKPPLTIIHSPLITTNEDYLAFEYENLLMSIIGGVSLFPIDKLKITLGLQRTDSHHPLHRLRQSNLDLYSEEQLQRFIRTASEKLEVGTKQLNYGIAE